MDKENIYLNLISLEMAGDHFGHAYEAIFSGLTGLFIGILKAGVFFHLSWIIRLRLSL